MAIGHGKGCHKGREMEAEEEAEERNLMVEEKMGEIIVKLRVSTTRMLLTMGCGTVLKYSTSSSH